MFAAATLLFAVPAGAAVLECLAQLTGRAAEARTEIEARKLALGDWLAKAKAIGPGFTRWQIANNRRLDCRRQKTGMFVCQASARPCTIKQVPAQRPPPQRPASGLRSI